MTNIESNGSVTALSNQPDHALLVHRALRNVSAGLVVFHPGAFGVMQGWAHRGVEGGLVQSYQDVLHALEHDGLIVKGLPPVEHPSAGNPVRITVMGWVRLSAMNAAYPVRAA